jgi:CubicO group peptidase (beta-lactamase class C family)
MITRRGFREVILSSSAKDSWKAKCVGNWNGVLETGSLRLNLGLEIDESGPANLFGLDERSRICHGHLIPTDTEMVIDFPSLRATFTVRNVFTDRIEGVWRQDTYSLPLAFNRCESKLVTPVPIRHLTKERLAELRKTAGSPALAAASARGFGSQRVWVEGERVIGTGIAASESDLWHLGSIGKSMTASLVARLTDSGAVDWDENVGEILNALAPDMNDSFRQATFRHLLSHRSGFPAFIAPNQFNSLAGESCNTREERKAFVRQALTMDPRGPIGATFEYSNIGYVVAGAMLEVKLDQSWECLIRTHVFEPLKLSTAGFGAPPHKGATNQPVGHCRVPDSEDRYSPTRMEDRLAVSDTDAPAVLGPAGCIHMSLYDLLRYLIAHCERTEFLKPQTWKILHTPPYGGDYALGWVVRSNGTLWHNGSNTLWYAEALIDPADGVVAAAASNDGYIAKSGPAVGRALLEAAAGI